MSTHDLFIRQSIHLAQSAKQKGNHPFGALLVKDGRVLLTAENTVNTEHDLTRHAELNLVSQASRDFDAQTLAQCILYTSTEPCAMCAGAIYWTGISKMVYGCSAERLGQLASGSFVVPSRNLFAHGKRLIEVIGPILEDEAVKVHEGFW